jgi:hypothetical protein
MQMSDFKALIYGIRNLFDFSVLSGREVNLAKLTGQVKNRSKKVLRL